MSIKLSQQDYDQDEYFFGNCYASENFDLMYIPIEKNVTKVVSSMLRKQGFQEYNFHKESRYNVPAVIILRDPVERWISGVVEYLLLVYMDTKQSLNNMTRHNLTPEKVFEQINFDAHTFPQSWFLQGLISDCDYIWFDQNKKPQLIETVFKYLGEHNYNDKLLYLGEYTHSNKPISDQKQQLTKLYKDMLEQNPDLLQKIKNFYAQDYELINSVKFYT